VGADESDDLAVGDDDAQAFFGVGGEEPVRRIRRPIPPRSHVFADLHRLINHPRNRSADSPFDCGDGSCQW
jgi:hypothetical protein